MPALIPLKSCKKNSTFAFSKKVIQRSGKGKIIVSKTKNQWLLGVRGEKGMTGQTTEEL
jgi:hypothetical protein